MDDRQLRKDVIEALDFGPAIDSADIGVAVEGGVIALTGHVQTYAEKETAIDLVDGVKGARAIADEIEVRPVGVHITADDEIAERIVDTLKWNTSIPESRIHPRITKGWVTLEGDVAWRYQASAAQKAVRRLIGVRGVNNHIKIKPEVDPRDVANLIRQAFLRDAEQDASAIRVVAIDGSVTFEGRVRTIRERRTAERAAWSAPGVQKVIDQLEVTP